MREVVAATGAQSQVMTSAGALVHGLEAIGAKKVSLLAPYMKPLTAKVVDYLEHEGIEVLDRISFEIPDNLAVGRRDPMQLLEDVKRLNIANADAVVLSACVQMPSLLAIARAQAQLGLPVTSTAVCTVRNMLDLLGLSRRFPTAHGPGDSGFSVKCCNRIWKPVSDHCCLRPAEIGPYAELCITATTGHSGSPFEPRHKNGVPDKGR